MPKRLQLQIGEKNNRLTILEEVESKKITILKSTCTAGVR